MRWFKAAPTLSSWGMDMRTSRHGHVETVTFVQHNAGPAPDSKRRNHSSQDTGDHVSGDMPAKCSFSRASTTACVSQMAPRAVLTRYAPFFILPMRSALNTPLGQNTTKFTNKGKFLLLHIYKISFQT